MTEEHTSQVPPEEAAREHLRTSEAVQPLTAEQLIERALANKDFARRLFSLAGQTIVAGSPDGIPSNAATLIIILGEVDNPKSDTLRFLKEGVRDNKDGAWQTTITALVEASSQIQLQMRAELDRVIGESDQLGVVGRLRAFELFDLDVLPGVSGQQLMTYVRDRISLIAQDFFSDSDASGSVPPLMTADGETSKNTRALEEVLGRFFQDLSSNLQHLGAELRAGKSTDIREIAVTLGDILLIAERSGIQVDASGRFRQLSTNWALLLKIDDVIKDEGDSGSLQDENLVNMINQLADNPPLRAEVTRLLESQGDANDPESPVQRMLRGQGLIDMKKLRGRWEKIFSKDE